MPTSAVVILLLTQWSLSALRAIAADAGADSERDWIPRRFDGLPSPCRVMTCADVGPRETPFGTEEAPQDDNWQPPHESESAGGVPLNDSWPRR